MSIVREDLFQELQSIAIIFNDGDWVESKDQDKAGGVRLIQLADIGDGQFLNKSQRFMNIETAKRLNCTFLKKDDILIARMPDPLGRCCLFPFDEAEKYVTVVDIAILRVKPEYSKNYIQYLINTTQIRHVIDGQITGTTRKRITRKKLEKLEIPLPPLAEQQQIAAILDAADKLRQKDQQLIDHYTTLSQSLFLDMFGDPVTNLMGWEQKSLLELTNKITDGTHFTPSYTESGIPFLRVTDVTESNDSKKFISKEEHLELIKRCHPVRNDILYTKNGTIGVGKIVDWDYDFSIFVSLCLLKPKHEVIEVKYLNHFLNTPFALRQAMSHSKEATIKNLHLVEIKKMRIPYPPMKKQKEFVRRLEQVEQQKQQAQASLEKSEALFNSLLQRAFNGELTGKKVA